jgi:hypothetical protein
MHAVLFRQWQLHVKGHVWFDLEWYTLGAIPLHLDHLAARTRQSSPWPLDQPFSARSLQAALLAERIRRLDVASARLDIERFIAQPEPFANWSQDYFQQLARRVVMA